MNERNKKLKQRVLSCKKILDGLNIKNARVDFAKKYPKYYSSNILTDTSDLKDRLNNLWYCKVFDEDFTKNLESFTKFKQTQYK